MKPVYIGTTHLHTSQCQSGCASELLHGVEHHDSMVKIIDSDFDRDDRMNYHSTG